MAPQLVFEVTDRLQLQGRMGHVEVAGQAALKMIQDAPYVTVTDAVVGHDDVRGENR